MTRLACSTRPLLRPLAPSLHSTLFRNIPRGTRVSGSSHSFSSSPAPSFTLSSSLSSSPTPSLSLSSSTSHSSNPNIWKTKDKILPILTSADAQAALNVLYQYPNLSWACDTEVANIDVKTQGPIGNGNVICVSIYGGPTVDFGNGPGSVLWIENINRSANLLQEFKPWFEDSRFKKVWHNYGFDRHVLHNEGINCLGFGGDTMHMARLWDTSLDKAAGTGGGYSLEAVTSYLSPDNTFEKISMKTIFGVSKLLKNGGESKVKDLPPLESLQIDPAHRQKWIEYSARDAVATWFVRDQLQQKLQDMPWEVNGKLLGNMYDYYMQYMCEFGELLTDMEREGIKVDVKGHVRAAEEKARAERKKMENIFLSWAATMTPDGKYINIGSSTQIQQLLFGEYKNGVLVSRTRTFKIDKSEEEFTAEQKEVSSQNSYHDLKVADLKALLKERKLPTSGKKMDLLNRLIDSDRSVEMNQDYDNLTHDDLVSICNTRGLDVVGSTEALKRRLIDQDHNATESFNNTPAPMSSPKKYREITIETLGLTPSKFTPAGVPMVSGEVLRGLAGKDLFGDPKDAVWGSIMRAFGSDEAGKRAGEAACRAIGALANVGQIDTMITNFLVPLQALADSKSRIHCSLNLNTETGRLSSRRPNLQNQPALEKDQYKIRDAFVAEEGNTFVVADYGQLELRLLAHITNCKSMLDAFEKGGCFHSRTAMGMYPYIKEAIDRGDVLLEWDHSKGKAPKPLVKDMFASERRKAKTLNFSIAYGKTIHGLAKDWGISLDEAKETLDAWYRDRPEVKEWQDKTRKEAVKNLFVRTMMGRYRNLPEAASRGPGGSHSLRAAINTPIQGSAADIVMMAMIKLWKSEVLKSLGWKLLLQIHDEVILEGPKETAQQAKDEVVSCMENPGDGYALSKLSVKLEVDAKCAETWYKAK